MEQKIKHVTINGKTYEIEGKTAYDIAVEHGFEGTEAEWLESLKGEQGEKGADGADGLDGASGNQFDKLDTAPNINLIDQLPLQQGSINFLTGANASSNSVIRTDFVEVETNASYTLSSWKSNVVFYVIFYDANKTYLGYVQSESTTVTFSNGGFDGATFFRVRIQGASAITLDNYSEFFLQFEKNTNVGYYVPPLAAFGYCQGYHEYLETSRLFNHVFNNRQRNMNLAVKELFIPDDKYKGRLKFSVLRKITGTENSINLIADGVMVYACDEQEDVSGVKLIKLKNKMEFGDSAYILVDWDALPNGTSYTGNTADTYVLSDKVYDITNSPTIADRLKDNGAYNGDIYADTAIIGEMTVNTIELRRNFSLPKTGTYLSTDIDFCQRTNDIKGLIPYLYHNGEKVGTIVLYDETNGDPYVFLKDGTKKYLG